MVIIGARPDGSARVVADTLRSTGDWTVAGFLDDNAGLWNTMLAGAQVLGGTDRLETLVRDGVTHASFALGDNHQRETLLVRARAAGLTPANAFHRSAIVATDTKLGAGIWLAAGAIVNPGAELGDGVVINTGATVDHDCRIGDYANISPGCHLSGRTTIGRYAFLGTGAITIPDTSIGEGAVVGAGAVVIRPVAAGARVAGVPARVLAR